ncbi:hypothetical protein EYR36_011786 [Pleurotus pulmonarius]|nr:hypothetical protein EYR36_011786 [Pleurotus pulmonarius]KAF4607321.1 hypothetical protein EYR38_001382 [Pleurotus pulmonarius]
MIGFTMQPQPDEMRQNAAPPSDAQTSEVLQVAYEIFGFIGTESDSTILPAASTVTWVVAQKCLGVAWRAGSGKIVGNHTSTDVSEDLDTSLLCYFFARIKDAKSLSDVPQSLLDLCRADKPMRMPYSTPLRFDTISDPHAINYVLGGPYLEVSLTNPLAVLYVARCHHQWEDTSIPAVATRLAGEGFGFTVIVHSFRYLPCLPPSFRGTPDNPLGFRPSNYVPTDMDYRSYVSQREELLQSPRGYAALMAGGLASRMARDFVAPELFYAKLSSDPNPIFFHPLTTPELDLIYGIYRQETGQVSLTGKRQFIHKSWWPPHKIWTSSMLGLTFWTTDAEAWYQRRINKLRTGPYESTDLKHAPAWKSAMRQNAEVTKIIRNMEVLAESYIRTKLVTG